MENHEFYWNSLQLWRYELQCTEYAYRREVKRSRWIKTFIAIVSSGSVAAWAVWGKYPILWGAIVAIGQIVSVVYEHTPYVKRISELGNAADALGELYEMAEEDWCRISAGMYSEDKILELRNGYSEKWAAANRKMLKEDTVSISKKAARKIEAEASRHMRNLYGERYEEIVS